MPTTTTATLRRLAAAGLLLALAGCAAVEANRRLPGVLSAGTFAPARPSSGLLGADPAAACPVGGAYSQVYEKVQKAIAERGANPAALDGQLCTVAEAFLGWGEAASPGEAVRTFVATHAGIAGSAPQVVINVLDSDDTRQIGDGVSGTILQYANQAAVPRYGLAFERLGKNKTRVVIALDSARVALDPLPRRLEPGAKATFSGKLLGELENPKVLVSGVDGVVSEPPQAPGKAFKAELACGRAGGRLLVELKAEDMGNESSVMALFIPCGGPALPTSVAVAAQAWPEDVAAQEALLAKAIDAERAGGGLPPLKWLQPLGKVAHAVAENMRDAGAAKGAPPPPVNVVQRLADADLQALLVLQNPAAGPTAQAASDRLLASPPHRATIMSPEVGTADVGVALGTDPAGKPVAYIVQLLVKVQPPPDVPVMRRTIVEVVGKKRADEKLPELAADPALEKLAADYAVEIAAAGGPPARAKTEEFEKALKAGYKDIVIIRDARFDLNDFAEDPNILTKGKLYGLGTALGRHPRLGKNTLFVVLVLANKLDGKPPAAKKK